MKYIVPFPPCPSSSKRGTSFLLLTSLAFHSPVFPIRRHVIHVFISEFCPRRVEVRHVALSRRLFRHCLQPRCRRSLNFSFTSLLPPPVMIPPRLSRLDSAAVRPCPVVRDRSSGKSRLFRSRHPIWPFLCQSQPRRRMFLPFRRFFSFPRPGEFVSEASMHPLAARFVLFLLPPRLCRLLLPPRYFRLVLLPLLSPLELHLLRLSLLLVFVLLFSPELWPFFLCLL